MTRTLLVRWPALTCAFLVLQIYSGHASAQSTAGGFSSVVTIGGSVKQEANGNSNTQVINAGGMNASNTGSFNATVSVGGITQTTTGSGGVQSLNAGSMSNSSARSFTANVNVGKLEQAGKVGERQEMDIGSVTNSKVSGAVNTTVNVRQGVKQVGEGEIAIGAVKNSNIGSFNNSITVNKVEGNNVRIGSVVGGSAYDKNGRFLNPVHSPTNSSNANANNPNSLQLPKFDSYKNASLNQNPQFGAGSTDSTRHDKNQSDTAVFDFSPKGSDREIYINSKGLRKFQNVTAPEGSYAIWLVSEFGSELPSVAIDALLKSDGYRINSGSYMGLNFSTNGCGAAGDGLIKGAINSTLNFAANSLLPCDVHDILYGTPGVSKYTADRLLEEMALSLDFYEAAKTVPTDSDGTLKTMTWVLSEFWDASDAYGKGLATDQKTLEEMNSPGRKIQRVLSPVHAAIGSTQMYIKSASDSAYESAQATNAEAATTFKAAAIRPID